MWVTLTVALIALGGSLALSLCMGLKACPLCFYQRTFVMGLVGVLGTGLVAGVGRAGRLSLLALPLATGGLGVALFHVSLELRGKLECPPGLFGLGTSPQQSLAAFVVLFALLLLDALRAPKVGDNLWVALVTAVVLGALLAVGPCIANPPPPPPPTERYTTNPPDVCRPPFHPH
jgi:disulfide bond formation protein DsbB